MEHESLSQALEFGLRDVRREICLARASETEDGRKALQSAGVDLGGGNFIAALALLCYTEFGGKLKFNCKKGNGSDHASENFNRFFDELGAEYKEFRSSGHNVYDIFRCGLAHKYYVKKRCTIAMFIEGPDSAPGVGLQNGAYYLAVERYHRDLKRALYALEEHLFPRD